MCRRGSKNSRSVILRFPQDDTRFYSDRYFVIISQAMQSPALPAGSVLVVVLCAGGPCKPGFGLSGDVPIFSLCLPDRSGSSQSDDRWSGGTRCCDVNRRSSRNEQRANTHQRRDRLSLQTNYPRKPTTGLRRPLPGPEFPLYNLWCSNISCARVFPTPPEKEAK